MPAPNPPVVGSFVEPVGIVTSRLWLAIVTLGPVPCWKVFQIDELKALFEKFSVRLGVAATVLVGKIIIAVRGIRIIINTRVRIRGLSLIFISLRELFLLQIKGLLFSWRRFFVHSAVEIRSYS